MTDLQEFEAFFTCMGVVYGAGYRDDECILVVAQAIFIFSVAGKYLRVEDDEMGGVYMRIKV